MICKSYLPSILLLHYLYEILMLQSNSLLLSYSFFFYKQLSTRIIQSKEIVPSWCRLMLHDIRVLHKRGTMPRWATVSTLKLKIVVNFGKKSWNETISYFSPLPAERGRDIYTLSNKCGMVGVIIILWGIF